MTVSFPSSHYQLFLALKSCLSLASGTNTMTRWSSHPPEKWFHFLQRMIQRHRYQKPYCTPSRGIHPVSFLAFCINSWKFNYFLKIKFVSSNNSSHSNYCSILTAHFMWKFISWFCTTNKTWFTTYFYNTYVYGQTDVMVYATAQWCTDHSPMLFNSHKLEVDWGRVVRDTLLKQDTNFFTLLGSFYFLKSVKWKCYLQLLGPSRLLQ